MVDSFWSNWGAALANLQKASELPTGSDRDASDFVGRLPTTPSQDGQDLAPVSTIDVAGGLAPSLEAPRVITRRLDLAPQYHRVPVRRPMASVTTWRFGEPVPLAESSHGREQPVAEPGSAKPKRRSTRMAAPTQAPLKDRVLALLQPPLESLLGAGRLWLPFEPFPYQFEGIAFLSGRWSALLADEMGLGKTMQTIMAIRLLLHAGMMRSAVLVCPKPLVSNWVREFNLWAEEIPVRIVSGETWARRAAWLHDPCPVKIVNYECLTRDEDLLSDGSLSFDLVVLDEAQRIKNRDGKTARLVHRLRRKRSWALTGTPVENRAADLASILEFVHSRPFAADERADTLRNAVASALLRRTKDMVLSDLPAKMVNDVYIDLGPAQRETYDAAEKSGVLRLNELGDAITIEHVFELVRRLKEVCNFDPATGESAKADRLVADIEELAESGRKAIVFSQWVTTLERIEDRLAAYKPLSYHGKISPRQREQVLADFAKDPNRPVLLLSYGVGAVGLNLQFTNHVFLFDRWWNPAVEDQAINRAHRIGQKEPVFVHRFLTPGTIEERIAQVLESKRELFRELIDGHEPSGGEGLSREDILGLFDLKVRKPTARAA